MAGSRTRGAKMHRLPVLLALAALFAGCPDREEATDTIGGQPGRIMEKVKGAAERAQEDVQDRLDKMEE